MQNQASQERRVVALGEPGAPLICSAWAVKAASGSNKTAVNNRQRAIEPFAFDKSMMILEK
jgi:hypothetical protein